MESKKESSIEEMERIIRKEFPKVLKRKELASIERKKVLKNFSILTKSLLNEKKNEELKKNSPPIHPWRLCALGNHWVKRHPRKVKPSKKNTEGFTLVDGHCRKNPSKKEQILVDEILRISEKYFKNLMIRPCPIELGFEKKNAKGDAYDELIAGWTQYWNDIFKPEEPLDPDLVKALIASESGFRKEAITPVPKRKNMKARGLMQITDETLKILNNAKGELKDHLVKLSQNEIMNPSANIYAGIRWLFHKKRLASGKLGREASWPEMIANYKGYSEQMRKDPNGIYKGMTNIYDKYELLKKCQK